MRKIVLFLIILPLLAACSHQSNPQKNSSPKIITVATAGDVQPFAYEENGNLTGYNIEILKAIDEKLSDYEIHFQRTAWESIFPGLDSGHYQAAANNLSYTKERADKYLYSLPISKNPLVLVSNKKNPLTSLEQIAGKTTQEDIGTSNAQFINNWNQKHTENPATIQYSGEDIGKRIFDLSNGDFDFLIFDKVSVQNIIKERGLDLSVIDLPSADSPNNYIIFSSEEKTITIFKSFPATPSMKIGFNAGFNFLSLNF